MERDCDFCKEAGSITPAVYDAKTIMGPWAYVCEMHYTLACYHVKGLTTPLVKVKE